MTETKENYKLPYYIIVRFFRHEILSQHMIARSYDWRTPIDDVLVAVKEISRQQPGIYILFQYPNIDNGNAYYEIMCACQDGNTVHFTTDKRYYNAPNGNLIYMGNDIVESWEFSPTDFNLERFEGDMDDFSEELENE